jgi:hypothetical protein
MGGKSGAKEAKAESARIRADEAARQKRIREGTSEIGRIFEGGDTRGVGQLGADAAYDPNAQYYTATGERWSPKAATSSAPSGAGKGVQFTQDPNNPNRYSVPAGTSLMDILLHEGPFVGGGGKVGDPQSQFADALKGGLFSGVNTSTGAFGGDFFDKRAKAFVDYATPQLESQRGDAAKDLIFALTRSGNLDSSTRATKEGELQKLYDTQRQNVIDQGQAYANTARTSVEDARSDLIKTLNATGDAQGAASGAINRAAALSQPDKFDPLSQLFADFTSTLGSQLALERAEAASGRDYARHNTGLFKPGRVSVS